MKKYHQLLTEKLFQKQLLSEEEYSLIKEYRSANLISLHNELQLFLYASVLLFTTGLGILIYQNINSIGHNAILAFLFLTIVISYYYSFKKCKGFQKTEVRFDNPIFDYLILLATILLFSFVGYLQYQYKPFSENYGLATIIPTIIAFATAYYFDNKSVLSIAITGIIAYVGLSISPYSIFNGMLFSVPNFSYYAISIGILFILWVIYSNKIGLKKHFDIIYLTYSLHLISLACLSYLVEGFSFIPASILTASSYYFYKLSFKKNAISLFIFILLYAYIGFNSILFYLLDFLDLDIDLLIILSVFFTAYIVISIMLFIKAIKNFNRKDIHDNI
jgi:hypothetical protein